MTTILTSPRIGKHGRRCYRIRPPRPAYRHLPSCGLALRTGTKTGQLGCAADIGSLQSDEPPRHGVVWPRAFKGVPVDLVDRSTSCAAVPGRARSRWLPFGMSICAATTRYTSTADSLDRSWHAARPTVTFSSPLPRATSAKSVRWASSAYGDRSGSPLASLSGISPDT